MPTLTDSRVDTSLLNDLDFELDDADDLCVICQGEATHVMVAKAPCPHDGLETPLCVKHVEQAIEYLDSLYIIYCLPCQPAEIEIKRHDVTFHRIKGN